MIPKRVKQFYINATDRMNSEDVQFVKKILNEKEFRLFSKLSKSEQKHCVRISWEILQNIENKKVNDTIICHRDILIKAGLLHDIGKINQKLNIIEKSIIVILNKLTKGNLKNIKKSKKIQCYYNHSNYSYDILKENNYDSKFLYIVKNHHNDDEDDEILEFFMEIDDKN